MAITYRRLDQPVDILVDGPVDQCSTFHVGSGHLQRVALQRTGHLLSELGNQPVFFDIAMVMHYNSALFSIL